MFKKLKKLKKLKKAQKSQKAPENPKKFKKTQSGVHKIRTSLGKFKFPYRKTRKTLDIMQNMKKSLCHLCLLFLKKL